MIKPTEFQQETAKAADLALHDTAGSRRFLVADEAGLGKTVVAQEIIKAFNRRRLGGSKGRRPLSIIYVCSNLAIARQNRDRLVGHLTKAGRERAIVDEDRLSLTLLADSQADVDKGVYLRLYAVTPQTSQLDASSRGKGGGTVRERALCYVLCKKALRYEIKGLRKALALNVSVARFKDEVRVIERDYVQNLSTKTVDGFRKALRRSLALKGKQLLAPQMKRLFGNLAPDLVKHMRLALANVALAEINPDLVIFDEFQRFDELIAPESGAENAESEDAEEAEEISFREEGRRLLQSLRGSNRALLLLSATPWIPYRSRAEIKQKSDNAGDGFIDVVRFLHGSAGEAKVEQISELLLKRRELLTTFPFDWSAIDRNHDDLQAKLTPIMARTERRRNVPDTSVEAVSSLLRAKLEPADLKQFRSFHECVEKGRKQRAAGGSPATRERDLEMLVPLWNSVPLPMQALGSKYRLWERARKLTSAAAIEPGDVERMRRKSIPHPRMRSLVAHLKPDRLALPWVSPSHAWWPLAGGWRRDAAKPGASEIDGKLLVFARFRAVVPTVAGLLSYDVESSARRRTNGKARSYERESDSNLLRLDSPTSFELFHPCPFLIEAEPVDGVKDTSVSAARTRVRRTLALYLKSNKLKVDASGKKARKLFTLIAGIEARLGTWAATKAAWALHEKALPENPDSIDTITNAELELLASLALSSPGVVLGRAMSRHWNDVVQENFDGIVNASWKGLRSRFNEHWIARVLRRSNESFPDAIRRAVIEGNLEATLDEHFWFLKKTSSSGSGNDLVGEFASSIALSRSSIHLHYGNEPSRGARMSLRCHVAAPFSRPDHTEEGRFRPDQVRRAFNSPFWPHVLVTTSIGQEGLDFHPWCQTLLHWDPPPGPVALEQREGRVDRHASLTIRRAVARDMRGDAASKSSNESPWDALARRANETATDVSGLQPWWIYKSARPINLRFELAGSEITERWNQAHAERGHYRLALGMPHQNELVGDLRSIKELDQALLARACLNLSPFSRSKYRPL